jgi:precorrin-2/cobalt-factor-2 C20-methyltransferase
MTILERPNDVQDTDLSTARAPAAVTAGILTGVGLGPGDPELLTVKAVRQIEAAGCLAYFAKKGRRGHARTIADPWIKPGVAELPLVYPLTTEVHFSDGRYIAELGAFYDRAAENIAEKLGAGIDVALLCEGDPLFYGSFMHIFIRLKDRCRIAVVPGVSGMSGCWTAAREPITWGDDILTVLPGTLPEAVLVARLKDCDAAVIMKLGTNFRKVRRALGAAGFLDRAVYVERGTMAGERIERLADKIGDDTAPYFSLIFVPGQGRRP